MTAHTITTTQVGKYEIALAANVEDTVTLDVPVYGYEVKVISGTKPVYVIENATATVKGADCYDVPVGTYARSLRSAENAALVLHIISEADAVVSVSKVR